jgi:hypothetical protein
MTSRLGFTLAIALAGCEATLGGGGSSEDAASALDARRQDSGTAMADAPRLCVGGGMLANDGSCMVFVSTTVTYAAAKSACAAMQPGGHLAYIKSQALHDLALTLLGAVDTWIGANDITTEMTFVWDDNSPLVFTNWSTGEPNNGGGGAYQEDCAIITGSRADKKWDDRPCDASEVTTSGMFAYLCQY